MVEFGPDLGPRGALKSGPGVQLGTRPENAAAGRLLWSLKEASTIIGDEHRFGAAVILYPCESTRDTREEIDGLLAARALAGIQ